MEESPKKKVQRSKKESITKTEIGKLKDQVIEARIEYKSLWRVIKVSSWFVGFIFIIIGFFGYNKMDSIESMIIERANSRLAQTDSILAKIDTSKINELNRRLLEKQREYETILENFQKFVDSQKILEHCCPK